MPVDVCSHMMERKRLLLLHHLFLRYVLAMLDLDVLPIQSSSLWLLEAQYKRSEGNYSGSVLLKQEIHGVTSPWTQFPELRHPSMRKGCQIAPWGVTRLYGPHYMKTQFMT